MEVYRIMNCPRCNAEITFQRKRCDNCGYDLKNYQRVISMSNVYYNKGLSQAKVRDLTGAVSSLRNSLKLNKHNTNARNLLGLVYLEEGEVVAALSEWVISKHFQENDNDADRYINIVQSNPNRLENYSQMVRKYNTALLAAKNGDEDMAVIQLKKVVSQNPQFIRASQLLALLYLKTQKKENDLKAYRILKTIKKTDATNTTTLRYLKELSYRDLKESELKQEKKRQKTQSKLPKENPEAYQKINLYHEERPTIMPFVHAIIGVIIGVVVMWFLVMPHLGYKMNVSNNTAFKTYSDKLASGDSDTTTLKQKVKDLQSQVTKYKSQIEKLQGGSPTDIKTIQTSYDNLFAASDAYNSQDYTKAADALIKVTVGSLSGDTSLKLYKKIKTGSYAQASTSYFEKGRDCYNGAGTYSGKQDTVKAISLLKKSLKFNADNTDAMYFLGRCYQKNTNNEKAKEYYNEIINNYPDSTRVTESKSRLQEMGD